MKNGIIVSIVLGVWALLKLAAKAIKALVQALTYLFIYFGLYIPLFYLVFGLILLATTDFTFGVMGTNQILYFVGLGLCFIASGIITFRTILVRPISFIVSPIVNWIREVRAAREERRAAREEEEEPDPRYRRDDLPRDRYDEDLPRYAPRDRYDRPYRDPYASQVPYEETGVSARYAPRPPYAPRDRYEPEETREYPQRDEYHYPPREDRYAEPSRDYAPEPDPDYRDSRDYPAPYPPERPSDYPDDPRAQRTAPAAREELPAYARFGARYPREPMQERPLIYYSRRRPGILVMEYSDRFELYREDANGREYVGTEYKDE